MNKECKLFDILMTKAIDTLRIFWNNSEILLDTLGVFSLKIESLSITLILRNAFAQKNDFFKYL